jgi:hypothetical protein
MHSPDAADPTLARAAAIVADSRTIGAARRAITVIAAAAIDSRTWSIVGRTLGPAPAPTISRGRVIAIALGAAALHAAAASALPAAALPTIPITAATLVAAVIALSGRST